MTIDVTKAKNKTAVVRTNKMKKSQPTPEELTTMRTCTKCLIEKPLAYFYRVADNWEKVCKDCRNLRTNSYLPPEPVSVTPEKPTKKAKVLKVNADAPMIDCSEEPAPVLDDPEPVQKKATKKSKKVRA